MAGWRAVDLPALANGSIGLSRWSPRYLSPQPVQHAKTMLRHNMLFGSDLALITPEGSLEDFEDAGFKPEARPPILEENALRLQCLGESAQTPSRRGSRQEERR